MCAPVAALALAGSALSALGTGVSAINAKNQADYQAKVAESNAQAEANAAQVDQQNMRTSALNRYRQIAQIKGAQRAGAAAGGVTADYGTAADVQADTTQMGQEDVGRIYQQGYQTQRSHDIAVANDQGQAAASRAAGTSALISGMFGAASTALGGASQYKKLKAGNNFGT
jgi:hypothetical protein